MRVFPKILDIISVDIYENEIFVSVKTTDGWAWEISAPFGSAFDLLALCRPGCSTRVTSGPLFPYAEFLPASEPFA